MLHKNNRINKKSEIDLFYGKDFARLAGKNYNGDFIFIKVLLDKKNKEARCGFVVSNKIANKATARNLIKRRLRAIVKKNLDFLVPECSLLIVAKPEAKKSDFSLLEKDFLNICAKGKLISK